MNNALDTQIGGNHYESVYQPIELMEKVRMYATCSYILKYVFRHKSKGQKQDLDKALHCCELMEQLGMNWYAGTASSYEQIDNSVAEFYRFIKENSHLDGHQIRAIIAICDNDMNALKSAIMAEIACCYEK